MESKETGNSSMKTNVKYTFTTIERCNMCGSDKSQHIILGKRMNQSQGRKPWKKTGITTTIVKCKTCKLIFSNPLPIPFSIQDHYGVTPESYWTKNYFTVDEHYFSKEIKDLKTVLNITDSTKGLDIGAGIGKTMIALEKIGIDMYGCEPSEPFYNRAIEKMNISKDKIKFASIEESEYPENTFDLITFGAVLEHLYDPSKAIERANKWLKPNGIMHIEVPSSAWLVNKLINFSYKIRGSDYVGNISPMHAPFHLYEFGLDSFKMHAMKNNYSIAKYYYTVCPTYLPKIIDVFIRPYMKRTNTGMQLTIYLKKN